MLSEQELENKRKEYRETELQNKIASYSSPGFSNASEFRQTTLKANYTYRKVDRRIPKYAWFLIITQAVALSFYSSLYIFSYVPNTKHLVAMVMP